MRVEKVVEVQTRRLDDIDEIPEFDLLKIDIQGAETDVFENGVNKLKSAVAVISEVAAIPIYEDQPLLDAQMRALSKQGFSLHKFLFFKSLSAAGKTSPRLRQRRFKNQLVDGDAVFLKNVLAIENQPTESLKHLALLADSVFRSIDIAVHALSHLVDRQVIHPTAIDDYLDFFPTELVLSREEVSLRR